MEGGAQLRLLSVDGTHQSNGRCVLGVLVCRRLWEGGPRGILGVSFLCEDCDQVHYYDWEIMEQNMIASLNNQLPPVHEPSANPNIEAYVPWDYAMGYLDGLEGR